jgi:hypothetical protein
VRAGAAPEPIHAAARSTSASAPAGSSLLVTSAVGIAAGAEQDAEAVQALSGQPLRELGRGRVAGLVAIKRDQHPRDPGRLQGGEVLGGEPLRPVGRSHVP